MRPRSILILLLLVSLLTAAKPVRPPSVPVTGRLHAVENAVPAVRTIEMDPATGQVRDTFACVVSVFDGLDGSHWYLRQPPPPEEGGPRDPTWGDARLIWSEGWPDTPCTSTKVAYEEADIAIGQIDVSRDGRQLAFSGARAIPDGTDPETDETLYRYEYYLFVGQIAPDGTVTRSREIPTPDYLPTSVSWDADGQRLAYTATPPGTIHTDLFVVRTDIDGASPRNLTQSPTVAEYQPTFSPVRNEIAFVKRTSAGGNLRNDIFVMDVSSGKTRQVTSRQNASVSQIITPKWSPDGAHLAFIAISKTGTYDVFRIVADGSANAVQLTSSPYSVMAPMWTR